MMTMNLDALEQAAVAGTMKWRDAHALVSMARQLLRLRAVARDFYNNTVANPELRLSASTKKVRDDAMRAGERLRESLEATAPDAALPAEHEMNNAKNNEAASVAQGMTLPQMEMLRALLVSIRPEYGTPGSRDVDIGRQQKRIDAALAILAQAAPPATSAARDVLAERQRQISAEGWTPEHDDEHIPGTLSQAAGCYIEWNGYEQSVVPEGAIPINWPWAPDWWKPKDERRNLVRAGALILAEIERLDRAAGDSSARAENTPPISANSAAIIPGTMPYPTEPTDALLEVLGLMLYTTTPIAQALRAAGSDIPKRCEEEQAYVLHWLIQLALQHGPDWRARATKSIEELQAATRGKEA